MRIPRGARLLVGAGLAVGPLMLMGGQAHAASGSPAASPNLGGWNVSADANVVDVLVDNETGLAGIHPVDEADFPESQSVFETGPFGSGLASVFWPGSAGGNFGSLSSELGLPSQLQPLASELNDPVKAATQYPAGPDSSSYPPGAPGGAFDMQSQAGPTGTTAASDIVNQAASGVLGFSSARSNSSATAGNAADATATSEVSGISLLGGIIDIASLQSTASASSDGNNSTGSASTHLTGVTVMGQPASIGSDGLVLPDLASSPLGPVVGPIVQNLLSQAISGLGLTITEFPSTQNQNGPSDSITSGGVAITIDPPSAAATELEQVGQLIAPYFPAQAAIIPTLPGLLQGATLTITLGRATASAAASPPFNDTFTPLGFTPGTTAGSISTSTGAGTGTVVAGPVTTGGSPTPAAAPSPALASPGTGGSPATAAPTVATPASSPSSRGQPSSGSLPAALVSLSTPLAAGVVVGGLAVAFALGYGLWRLARLLRVQDAGPECPLGQDVP